MPAQANPIRALNEADLDDLLTQAAFNRFIWRVLEEGRWMQQTYTRDAGDMAFAEGRRAMATQIMGWCLERRDDALIRILHEGATTLAPLIKGQELPDERSNPLYRDDD